jgi:hypothetical protein
MPTLSVPPRFRGPAGSANGGYMCGRVAGYVDPGHLDGPVRVTLRRPPPLTTPMTVETDRDGAVRVLDDGILVAEAATEPGNSPPRVPGTVPLAEARAAQGQARFFQDPAFPECFVCGKLRRPGDGLRIFPGPVAGRALWAAPWTPDASVADASGYLRPEIAWAALDCPSGIAAFESTDIGADTAILLGQMSVSLGVLPAVGDECVVIGWPVGRDGRKLRAGSALLRPGGQVLAAAETVWLTVPRQASGTAVAGAP